MASPSTTINANLNINPASVKSAQKTVQSAFSNINLNPKSVSQFSNSLGRITGQASEFKKSMDAATARVFAFGATAAVINGISQSFKSLVASTIEVEKSLIEINSIFGATEKQFASFRKSIFEVARNTGQSFAVVADGAAELARQGLSAEETAKRLNASLILTRVSGLDAVSSVNSLTAALNGFTSAGLTAETVVNKIIAVDTAFAVSAKDLAEGFQRAGSTAEDAGVSFDELLGLITSVQQKTARGGAVIGNAFKSIFTRLSRGTTISELQELGVQIDASQSGVQKLQALSSALERVADPNVASKIKELAGGVFQINVVSAALKDLSSETSIFADAASKSATASNEAFSKNEALNKSLSAQINALIAGATNLAEKLGQLTLGPIISDLTSLADKFTGFLNNALDEDSGNSLIKGFFKGIAAFIQGPGIILVTGAFLNIFKIVAKFAKEGFQDLLKIGSGQEKIKSIEAGIVQLLSQDATLRKQLVSTTLTQAQKEQLVIQAIQRENALLKEQQAILAQLAASAARAGVTGFGAGKGFSGKKGKGFARGFVPNFAVSPQEEMMEVAGAAIHGYKAGKVKKGRIFDGSGGSFTGVFNSAEKKENFINAGGFKATMITPPNGFAQGFVPNFNLSKANKTNFNSALAQANNPKNKDQEQFFVQGNPYSREQVLEEGRRREGLINQIGSKDNRVKINASAFGFLIPKVGAKETKKKKGNFSTPTGQIYFDMTGVDVRGPLLPANIDKVDDPESLNLEKSVRKKILGETIKFARVLVEPKSRPRSADVGKRLMKQKGGKGAIQGAVGAAFEAGVSTALGVEEVKINKDQGDFDLRGAINKDLFTLFGINKPFALGEFKASAEAGNLNSFAKKIVKERTGKSFNLKGRKSFSSNGFIPNFATSNAGVPVSKIRFHQDKDGRSFITNTRDEPRGALDVPTGAVTDAINRERQGISMFSDGFVPNFIAPVPKNPQPSKGAKGVSGLGKKIDDTGNKAEKASGAFNNLGFAFSFLVPAAQDLGEKFNKAAEEAEDLSNRQVDLENALSRTNKETEPELFKKFSDELAEVNKDLKEAEQASAKYSSSLFQITSAANTGVFLLTSYSEAIKKVGERILASNLFGGIGIGGDVGSIGGRGRKKPPPLPKGGARVGGRVGGLSRILGPLARFGPSIGRFALTVGKFTAVGAVITAAAALIFAAGKAVKKAFDDRAKSLEEANKDINNLTSSDRDIIARQTQKDSSNAGFIGLINEFRAFNNATSTAEKNAIAKDIFNPLDNFASQFTTIVGGFKTAFADSDRVDFSSEEIIKLAEALDKNPFKDARQEIEKTLNDLPNVFQDVQLGDKLSIAFRDELSILENSIARTGSESTRDLRRTGLKELSSSGVLNLAGKDEQASFQEKIRRDLQGLDIESELAATTDFGEQFKQGLEESRAASIKTSQKGLKTEAGKSVDLARVDAAEGESLANTLDQQVQQLTGLKDIISSALAGGPSDEVQAALDSLTEEQRKLIEERDIDLSPEKLSELDKTQGEDLLETVGKVIQDVQGDADIIRAAGGTNQAALDSAATVSGLTAAIDKITEASSQEDIQKALGGFGTALDAFKAAGGSSEDAAKVTERMKEVLGENAARLKDNFEADRKERERVALQEINSRLELINSQKQFISSLQNNFESNLESFDNLRDPNKIIANAPNFGDRKALFELGGELGLSGQQQRKLALASSGQSAATILANDVGQQDQINRLTFGTEFADIQKKIRLGERKEDGSRFTKADLNAAIQDQEVQARLTRGFTEDELALQADIGRRKDFDFSGLGTGAGITAQRAANLERTIENVPEFKNIQDIQARLEELDKASKTVAGLTTRKGSEQDKLQGQAATAIAAERAQLIDFLELVTGADANIEDLVKEENEVRREGIDSLKARYNEEKAAVEAFVKALQSVLEDLGVEVDKGDEGSNNGSGSQEPPEPTNT